jgi:beta-N-acetylhexosaminidase
VVELEPDPGMAAGRLPQGSSDWIRDSVKSAESIRLHNGSVDAALAAAMDRQLVVVVRDAHRHEWERTAVESLLTRADDAVVVETGLPVWRPSGGAAYIATFGAARVNLEAAAERL